MGKKKQKTYFDYSLVFIIIFLLCLGFVMLYSITSYSSQLETGSSTTVLFKQMFSTSIGLFAMVVVALIPYDFYKHFALFSYVMTYILILLVLTPLGIERNGARRWIGIAGQSFQPAEFAKIAIILFLAFVISKTSKQAGKLSYILKMLGFVIPIAGMIVIITSNLSSAIIVFGIGFVMIFVASSKYSYFIGMVVVGGVSAAAALFLAGGYRLSRIMVWLNPEKYSQEGGYQVLQGLYAIGSGGLFGKGLGQSVQKLGYVPEAENDMVFAIICEELGFVGAVAVIILFVFMIWRFMIIASNAQDLFASLLVVGIMTHIAVQVVLNIAVVTNTIPNTGITLPFISYGGTSVLFLLTEMGMVLSISRGIMQPEKL